MPQDRMQVEATMRGIAVEIQRHAHERDLNHHERDEHITPEIEVQNSIQEIEIHDSTLLTRTIAAAIAGPPKPIDYSQRAERTQMSISLYRRLAASLTSRERISADTHLINFNQLDASAFRNSFVVVHCKVRFASHA
jgi:hypothetical protein